MNQLAGFNGSQTHAIASMNQFRSSNEMHFKPMPQPQTSTGKSTRRRGVILTQKGWQKLQQAGVLYDEFGKRYTHEELSERSLLDARTVSRVLSCEVKVDKGTLKTFFQAFNLQLEAGDYTKFGEVSAIPSNSQFSRLTFNGEQESLPINELMMLKQNILEDLNRLFHLLETTSIGSEQFHSLDIARQFLTQHN